MSDKDQGKAFGEKLMGMEGFTPARAEKYRAEMEGLLAHRLKRQQRWSMGAGGAIIGVALIVGGVAMATSREHPEVAQLDFVRWTVALVCVLAGILLGGWLLWVAIMGQYERRSGDIMGLVIVLVFAGGWGGDAGFRMGDGDAALRTKLLWIGGVLLVLPAACLLLAILQWMHRQTQERLLRIEYRLAELMEHRQE